MPPAKKRKTAPSTDAEIQDTSPDTKQKMASSPEPAPIPAAQAEAQPPVTSPTPTAPEQQEPPAPAEPSEPSSSKPPAAASSSSAAQDRLARFRALQERAKKSSTQNLQEATKESQRLATAPGQLTALGRKHAIASHKLLKAEIEDAGGDFERKRAWDWTVEESEAWDKRTRKKEAHRDNAAFRDYNQEAKKSYKRNLRGMGAPDLERYTREKMAMIERAAAAGTLEIVETEDGEMIAVDKDGTFFSTADSTTGFAQHKPDKAAIDRLVGDLKKQEEAQLKKRRERMERNADDGGDVTYINEKNKQFNAKLERFYNKYTTEIRNSFERGTMI